VNEPQNRSSEPTPSPQGTEFTLESSTLYLLEKNLCEKLGVFTTPEAARVLVADLTHGQALWRVSPGDGCQHGRVYQEVDNYWITPIALVG